MSPDSQDRRTGGRKDAGPPAGGGPSVGTYAGHGLTFAAAILVFLYLGKWLDGKLGTEPWLMMVLMFVGAGAAFYRMYRELTAAQERDDAERKARREGKE